jgi:transcriptional regulator GlxA family with amidase domain
MWFDSSRPVKGRVQQDQVGIHPALHTVLCGTISEVTSRPAAAQHLRDLALLRRVRDRIDREYAQPLDVEALARGAHMSAGHLSRQFRLASASLRTPI